MITNQLEQKYQILDLEQGSPEWLSLRKTKITATDASVIMGVNPWKTKYQLYHEKKSDLNNTFVNDAMSRGLKLEPIARELFCIQKGIQVEPKVVVMDWLMASLDGLSECGSHLVEIKCPGESDYKLALEGKIPEHYYPQLQHQMYVTGIHKMYYFSFDGTDGVTVEVERDNLYIFKMLEEENKFYNCLLNNVEPEFSERDYIERNDAIWLSYAENYKILSQQISDLEQQLSDCRNEMISMCDNKNTKGHGISLCQYSRRGAIDYGKIPELKNIDLDQYRKTSNSSWRVTLS